MADVVSRTRTTTRISDVDIVMGNGTHSNMSLTCFGLEGNVDNEVENLLGFVEHIGHGHGEDVSRCLHNVL